jgi:hypothetical protein
LSGCIFVAKGYEHKWTIKYKKNLFVSMIMIIFAPVNGLSDKKAVVSIK